MTNRISFFNCKSILIIAVCLFSSLNASAAASEKNQMLVTQNLSRKLQSDLGDNAVRVKINNVEEYKISRNEVAYKGDAVCILADAANQLPIQFEAKVNSANQSVSDVRYDFVENVSAFAPTSNEELLMKELMGKIKSDYKTDNIVIAIDAVENIESAGSERKFLGFGEVRIGDFVWNKIKFDVALDAETGRASKIVYRVEK